MRGFRVALIALTFMCFTGPAQGDDLFTGAASVTFRSELTSWSAASLEIIDDYLSTGPVWIITLQYGNRTIAPEVDSDWTERTVHAFTGADGIARISISGCCNLGFIQARPLWTTEEFASIEQEPVQRYVAVVRESDHRVIILIFTLPPEWARL